MVEFLYLFQFSLSIEFSPCQIPYNCEMSASRALRPYVIRFVSSLQPNGSKRCRYRTMATATMDTPTLPLAGIRVLDMTRVLAGVRFNTRDSRPKRTDSVPAILYANPRRPRVSRNLQYDIPPILVEWSGIRYKNAKNGYPQVLKSSKSSILYEETIQEHGVRPMRSTSEETRPIAQARVHTFCR